MRERNLKRFISGEFQFSLIEEKMTSFKIDIITSVMGFMFDWIAVKYFSGHLLTLAQA